MVCKGHQPLRIFGKLEARHKKVQEMCIEEGGGDWKDSEKAQAC